MLVPAILTFRTYSPKKITKNMLFHLTGDNGSIIYQLDKKPTKDIVDILGLPVRPYIVSLTGKSHTLVSYEQIGYICDDNSEEVRDVDVDWFNSIMDNGGRLEIEMDGNKPFLLEGKVLLNAITKEVEYAC